MSSESVILTLDNIGKCYRTYAHPRDRLKQFLMSPIRRSLGLAPSSYFNEVWALRHITLELKKGESVGIVGRNGSGKSTLLQIVTGVLTPTEGSTYVRGRVAALLELGSGFNPEFTGRENVMLNGALLGFSRSELSETFDAIASFADIGEFIDYPVKTYSSGMFVRLAFAVQVQLEPDILIVDEALAVGDALFQKRCLQRLKAFLDNGGTLLFVSHDQEIIRTLTSRAVLLDGGRCQRIGPSSEVVLDYRRRIHEAEMQYVSNSTSRTDRPTNVQSQPEAPPFVPTSADSMTSYGDFDAFIKSVEVLVDGTPSLGVVQYGETVRVRVTYEFVNPQTRLSFGMRLRNKEGVKIYSGGTLAADLAAAQNSDDYRGVWHRTFRAGEEFVLDMSFECRLGDGLYEIQVYVCEEEFFMPGYQRMLHWKDEAAFFTVTNDRLTNWFGGVYDIGVKYEYDAS